MLLHQDGMHGLARHQVTCARLLQSKSAYQYDAAAKCDLTMQHEYLKLSRHWMHLQLPQPLLTVMPLLRHALHMCSLG